MSQLLRRFSRAYFDEMIRAHAAGRTLPASDLRLRSAFIPMASWDCCWIT